MRWATLIVISAGTTLLTRPSSFARRPDRLVRLQGPERLVDLAHELRAEGVQDLRPVQGDRRDGGRDVDQNVLVPHGLYDRRYAQPASSGLVRTGRRRPSDLDHRPL